MKFETQEYSDGSFLLSKIIPDDKEEEIIIPEVIDGHYISEIAPRVAEYAAFKKLVVPAHIKDLSEKSFYRSRIDEIVILSPITHIPKGCFAHSSVEKIVFEAPESIESIGEQAFAGTFMLQKFDWPVNCSEIPKGCFYGSEISEISGIEKVSSIQEIAFKGTALTNFVVPEKVSFIPAHCFEDSEISSIEFKNPENIFKIGAGAFQNTGNLQKIDWPSGCKEIPCQCFNGSGLTEFSGGEEIEVIGEEAFSQTKDLHFFTWPSKCAAIPGRCFRASGIQYIKGIENVEYIMSEAFRMSDIKEITLYKIGLIGDSCFELSDLEKFEIKGSDKYLNIGARAFKETRYLKKFVWPEACKVIPTMCFKGSSLSEITGLDNVDKVYTAAFENTNVEFIDWPQKCGKVPTECFKGTSKLKKVKFNSNNIKIHNECFENSSVKEIDVSSCDEVKVSLCSMNAILPILKLGFDTAVISFNTNEIEL